MNSRVVFAILALMVVAVLGYGITQKEPEIERPGIAQKDDGRKHVESKEYGGEEPPTSGDHANPIEWKVYDTEVRDDNVIHNMEHGGMYVSYRPDLPQDQIDRLKALLGPPYSNPEFKPTKALLAPRAANTSPIVVSSWTRSMKLESFDEKRIVEYYLANFGKSPEPSAQ